MEKVAQLAMSGFPSDVDPAIPDRRRKGLEGGDSTVWVNFESFLYIPAEDSPWYSVFLDDGSWTMSQHGTLPRSIGQIPPSKALKHLVGKGWRGVHCGYTFNTAVHEVCIEVRGQASGLFKGGELSPGWSAAVLLKSWLAVTDWFLNSVDWGRLLGRPTVDRGARSTPERD